MAKELATTPGRGRKLCPSCNKSPGVRSKVCQCGHEFVAKTVAKKLQIKVMTGTVSEVTQEPQPESNTPTYSRNKGPVVIIPNGVPPVKLEGTSIEVVRQWMIDTRTAFGDRGYLTHEGLCYWVKYFYPYYKSDAEGRCVSDKTGDIVRAIIQKIDGVGERSVEDESNARLVQSESVRSEQFVSCLPSSE